MSNFKFVDFCKFDKKWTNLKFAFCSVLLAEEGKKQICLSKRKFDNCQICRQKDKFAFLCGHPNAIDQ